MQQSQLLQSVFLILLIAPCYVLSRAVAIPEERQHPFPEDDGQDFTNENSVLRSGVMLQPKGEESIFFEGDIRLTPGQDPYNIFRKTKEEFEHRSKRHVEGSGSEDTIQPVVNEYENRDDLWEGGVVYFKFETALTPMYRDIFTHAMDMWTNATNSCITFHHANDSHKDFIFFRKDTELGCSSYVGRIGGEQEITISSDCAGVGHAAHEIGHALGLWHEHSRPDRDEYVEILYDNIIETEQDNFGILSSAKFAQVPPVPYDIESLMHYGPTAFAKNLVGKDQPTIRALPRDKAPWGECDDISEMGQRERISFKDVLRVKLLYKCGHVSPTDLPADCNTPATPTPTPTTTTESSKVTVPTPSPTTTKRLKTNDVITLQMGEGQDRHGVRCSPSCTPTPCRGPIGLHLSLCTGIHNQFKIINPAAKKIRSGDTVLLRSVDKPSTFMNCSGPGCKMTSCTSNAADPSNSSQISTCEEHFFIVSGLNRSTGSVLNTAFDISLKSFRGESYLNCLGKKCEMTSSEPQYFDVAKV